MSFSWRWLVISFGWALCLPAAGRAEQGATPFRTPAAAVSFADVAEAIKPAVINIRIATGEGESGFPFDEFSLFGQDRPEQYRRFFRERNDSLPRRSLGSGVIIDPAGVALTAAHVIENVSNVEAVTLDGRKHAAKIVGRDRRTDLAVLRLEDRDIQYSYAPLGDSDRARVGDWVIAVGSPYGLEATVTAGIISGKARHLGPGPFDGFLQTDAAINVGNSGGPLVNMDGEVIGINTAIVAGSSGIGFAIPSNVVKAVYRELLAKGKVSRPWLGILTQPLTHDLAQAYHAPRATGLLVSDLVPGGPGETAGLRLGDILLEMNGATLDRTGDLQRALARTAPGDTAGFKVWRERREQTIETKIGEEPN